MENYDPSAPPEELIGINHNAQDDSVDYRDESKDEFILPVTPGTAKAEILAAQILDAKYVGTSLFRNEQVAASIWCSFIFLYWTPCIWFPLFYHELLVMDSMVEVTIWCLGFIALLVTSYCLKEGQNPSGSTIDLPNAVDGKSRYATIVLVLCILMDFTVRIYAMGHGLLSRPRMQIYDLILLSGHTVSIFWCSFFYYGRFRQINPEIATFVFISEWIDIMMSIAVFAVLVLYVDDGCVGHNLCDVYFIIIPIKFILWIVPMMMIKGWGTKPNGRATSMQLFLTNFCTDIPIIVLIQYTQLYRIYTLIYIDLCIKSFVIIRGTSYYGIFNIWLKRGLQRQRKSISKKHRDKNKKHPASEEEIMALKT